MKRKLRIFVCHPSAVLTDHEPHGDGLIVYNFIEGLSRRGHSVCIVASRIALQAPLPVGVTATEIKLRSTSKALRRLEYGIRSRMFFESMGGSRAFDIIHQFNPVFTGISMAFVMCGVPVVLGSYAPYWPGDCERKGILHRIASYTEQALASALLITTPAALSRIVRRKARAAKTVELPYGVDTERFFPGERGSNAMSILYVASLQKAKGIYTLLDAFEKVTKTLPEVRLVIAGTGAEEQNIRRYLHIRGLEDRVDLLGHVARCDLRQTIVESTVLCMPSFGEPYGMSVVEAMSCGRPVVVTNAGGLAYIVDDSGGRRVPPGDSVRLGDALLEILRSPKLACEMGDYNRKLVLARNSRENVVSRLENIYEAVLEGRLRDLHA